MANIANIANMPNIHKHKHKNKHKHSKKGKKESKKVESHFLPLFHRNFQLFNNLSTKFSTFTEFSTKNGSFFESALIIGKKLDNVENYEFSTFCGKLVAERNNFA